MIVFLFFLFLKAKRDKEQERQLGGLCLPKDMKIAEIRCYCFFQLPTASRRSP